MSIKKITQFRYYGINDSRNYPNSNIIQEFDLHTRLTKGTLLRDYGLVSHIGIQGIPGTLFYLNGTEHPIRIGDTGIYELDLEGRGQISSIQIPASSLGLYEPYVLDEEGNILQQNSDDINLYIDIVYEGAGEF